MHLAVAGLGLVLGGGRCPDDRGIDDGAAREGQAQSPKMRIDQRKDPVAQAVRFQPVAELADRGLIGRPFVPEVDPDKGAHGARVIKRFFHRRVRDVEPVLEELDAKHPLKTHYRATGPVIPGIKRLNQRAQRVPRHDPIHVVQELLASCRFLVLLESGFGEGGLLGAHRRVLH